MTPAVNCYGYAKYRPGTQNKFVINRRKYPAGYISVNDFTQSHPEILTDVESIIRDRVYLADSGRTEIEVKYD